MALRDMQWRSGLWRLWIVLTIAWAAFVVLSSSIEERLKDRKAPVRLSTSYMEVEFPSDLSPETMRNAIIARVKQDNAENQTKRLASHESPEAQELLFPLYDPPEEARKAMLVYYPPETAVEIIGGAVKWAVLPPLAVLAIAFVIGWIARGFSPKTA